MKKLLEHLRTQGLSREEIDKALDEFFPETLEQYRERQDKFWENKVMRESKENRKGSLVFHEVSYKSEQVKSVSLSNIFLKDISEILVCFTDAHSNQFYKAENMDVLFFILSAFASKTITTKQEIKECLKIGMEKGVDILHSHLINKDVLEMVENSGLLGKIEALQAANNEETYEGI